jgi:starch synthase
MSDYAKLGLLEHYVDKFHLFDPIGGEHMDVFMAGLITAHWIVTVSHRYARECQMQGGWGFDVSCGIITGS